MTTFFIDSSLISNIANSTQSGCFPESTMVLRLSGMFIPDTWTTKRNCKIHLGVFMINIARWVLRLNGNVMKSDKARSLIENHAVGSSRDAASSLLKRMAIMCRSSRAGDRGKGARKGAQNHSRHDEGYFSRRYTPKDSRRIYPKTERRW